VEEGQCAVASSKTATTINQTRQQRRARTGRLFDLSTVRPLCDTSNENASLTKIQSRQRQTARHLPPLSCVAEALQIHLLRDKTELFFSEMSSLRESIRAGVSKRTDFPVVPSKAALLIIDVQQYCCDKVTTPYYRNEKLQQMTENIRVLADLFRMHRDKDDTTQQQQPPNSNGCEVIFVMIQSKTKDGRDLSIDYKLSGPYFASCPTSDNSYEEIFLPSLQPNTMDGKGDIVVPKTACSVFNSTNLDYILRNLFVEQLIITGQLTEQCVESAVRDAADLGYLVTVVDDACATHTKERHEQGLRGMKGFCRIVSTTELVKEFNTVTETGTKQTDGNQNKKLKTKS
jgi:ureidoacrylate peracid hydrolase